MRQKILKPTINDNKKQISKQVQIQDFKPVTLVLNRIKKSQNAINEFDYQNNQSKKKFQFPSLYENQTNNYENSWRNGNRNYYQQIGRKVKTQYQMPEKLEEEDGEDYNDQYNEGREHSEESEQQENQENYGNQQLIQQLCELIKHKKIKGQMSEQLNSRVKRVLQAANVTIPSRNPLSQINIPNQNQAKQSKFQNIKNRIHTQIEQGLQPSRNFIRKSKNPQYLKTTHSEQKMQFQNFNHEQENQHNYNDLWNTFNGKDYKMGHQQVNKNRRSQSVDKNSIGKFDQKGKKQKNGFFAKDKQENQNKSQRLNCKKRVLSYAVQMADNHKSKSKEKKKINQKQLLCKNSSTAKLQNQPTANSNRYINRNNENKSKSKQKLVNVSKKQKKTVTKLLNQRSNSRNKSHSKLSSHLSTAKLKTLQNSFKINKNGQQHRKIHTQADKIFNQIDSDQQLFTKPKGQKQSTSTTLQLPLCPPLAESPQFFLHIQSLQQKKLIQQSSLESQISHIKQQILFQKSVLSENSHSTAQLQRDIKFLSQNSEQLKKKKKQLHKKLQVLWSEVKNINNRVLETQKQNQRVLGMVNEEKELILMYETVIDQIKQQLKIEIDAKDQYKKMVALGKKNQNASRIKANVTKDKTQYMLENVRSSINKWIK